MTDESKVRSADILEAMQAGHRARIDGTMLQNLKNDAVQFQEVLPEASAVKPGPEPDAPEENSEADSAHYRRLLEQMRGVYASSWDSCSCGSKPSWNGGHNHFYDPCSGADASLPGNCPAYDCDPPGFGDSHHSHHSHLSPKPPRPPKPPYYPEPDCGCATTTCYDDDSYYLKKMSDQLNRIETLAKENYAVNQQLAGYVAEYLNKLITS